MNAESQAAVSAGAGPSGRRVRPPDLRPSWKKRGYYLPLLGAVVVNGIVYGAFTYRLATKQERLARAHDSRTREVAVKRGELARLQAESERLAQNDEEAVRFWNEVVRPREPGLTEAWDEMARLARESGVSRGRTTYEHDELDVGLSRVQAKMPVKGRYFNLVSFINRLERSPRFFLIQELGLKRAPGQKARANVELELDCGIAFFLK
ncbi:MAG: hypothetical protein ACE5JI_09245 [Acidobacteriota bacterium]